MSNNSIISLNAKSINMLPACVAWNSTNSIMTEFPNQYAMVYGLQISPQQACYKECLLNLGEWQLTDRIIIIIILIINIIIIICGNIFI